MFNLRWPKTQPKPSITRATWHNPGGPDVTVDFDPPLKNVWHALTELSHKRRGLR